jgi:regulatory factor X, other
MNVLRSVALSTNSVAASVEPVMQQQFFTLSPMPGQENFSAASLEPPARPTNGMIHTPTTSSMLAALQNDSFPVDSFGADFGLPSFMDTTPSNGPDDTASGLAFPDFSAGGTPFDVSSSFAPSELSLPAGTPAASGSPEDPQLQS